jgi:futalosine hydrolase
MKILVTAATALEIKPFITGLRQHHSMHEIDVVITGIGLVAATYALAKQVGAKRPDLVIQAGIAGSFDKAISRGTVVAISKEAIGDLGVMEAGSLKSLFDLGFIKPNQPPFTRGWLINKSTVLKKSSLQKVSAISINEVTTSRKRIELYKQLLSPMIESMEGAALHYVCLREGIEFIQLRAVSNYVGERDKKKWDFKTSIENLSKQIELLLKDC